MTGPPAAVAAKQPLHIAGLLAGQRASALVTGFVAFVSATGHGFAAGQAAAEVLLVAGDCRTLLVSAMAPPESQEQFMNRLMVNKGLWLVE